MYFYDLQKDMYSILQPFGIKADEIPLNFDFTKGIGGYFAIESLENGEYMEDYPLKIHLVGLKKDKITVQIKANEIEESLRLTKNDKWRLIKANVFITTLFDDEGKFNLIMNYYIRRY